ncbi:arylamine N-acetyltransferase family protein [Halocatena salina]|uniref:Arylamine N-acetyltransferase n=1 Tax=Halocatena salina TaxID=2934340 RepID=A0A8U0A8B9_9EURY|nr:arylamine N-acetyltransferase [Halocatena salina]UPM45099.1 arylamine N-acetyltransferase [Halocatena salina]
MSPDSNITPNLEHLRKLQRSHLLSVPFETLDIARDEPIVLDRPSLYTKIVERKRGGFCYELNSLFGWLLDQLGYDVRLIEGRVRHEGGNFGPPFDHMALLINLDRSYVVDVGYGRFCRVPLPLSGDSRTGLEGTYEIVPADDTNHYFAMELAADEGWKPTYRFTTAARELSDFNEMCEYQQTAQDSPFTGRTLCTIATTTGRITLSNDSLTVTEKGHEQTTQIESKRERDRILNDRFGISF